MKVPFSLGRKPARPEDQPNRVVASVAYSFFVFSL